MVKELMNGKMAENTVENIFMIKNKGSVNIGGLTDVFMRDTGKMENKMAKENIFYKIKL